MKNILFIIFLTLSLNSWAQKQLNEPDIFFEHLYLPGALHFNPINDIIQDNSGLLWFATDNGVYRYDGYELVNSNDFPDFQAIRERQVWSVMSSPDNRIYGSLKHQKGIFSVNNDFSDFKYYNKNLSAYNIHQLFYFDESICFLSRGQGLFHLDKNTQQVTPIYEEKPVFSYTISNDTLYAGSYNMIIIYHDSAVSHEIELPELEDYIRSIHKKDDQLWIATRLKVYNYNIKTGKIKEVFFNNKFSYSQVNEVFMDEEGQLWVLTEWSGIYILKNQEDVRHFKKSYYQKGSLSNNRASTIFQSQNGILWIGSGAGINKFDRHKRYFNHINHDPSDPGSLSANLVRGIYEDSDEELLIGTDDGIINIIDPERKNIRRVSNNLKEKDIVPFYFLEDNTIKGTFYVGTNKGLILFNKYKNSFVPIKTPVVGGAKRVRQMIYYDSTRLLCLSKGKLWFLNTKTHEYEFITAHPKDEMKTLRGKARTLYKDQQNNLFIGGMGDVALYDPETNEFHHRRIVSASEEGDSINHMILFLQRYGDKLYIGTFQGGLYILDVSEPNMQGSLVKYNKNSGLPDNTIYAALRDSKGFIWLTTNMGVSRYNPISESFYNYDRENGLQGEEFNRLAFAKTKRGEFIFGGIEGLNIFFPDKIHSSYSIKSDPVLISVGIINQFSESGTNKNPTFSLLNKKEITLDFDQNYLNFKFTSTNFSQPEKNKFYYKLENYDKEWIYSKDRSATYTGLAPGNYTFKVKSVAPDGGISTTQASIPISITTRWWKSWWAGLLFGSVVFVFIAISFRRRVKKSRAIKSFLEKEIERRTKELQQSKEELDSLNKRKDFIFSILSHDLRSPLTTLKGFLGILVDHFDTLDEREIKTHAMNIKNSVAKSLDLLDNTLFWSLSQMGDISYSPNALTVNTLFEKIIGLYDLTAQKKNITIQADVKENITLYVDENMAYITLRNLVSNAIKFTPSGKKVFLSAYKNGAYAYIIIEDEGRGIKSEDLSKLFDQNQNFMQKGTSNEKGTGLGLILCKKFTEMNNGTISVKSTENYGSVFTVKLPLYKEEPAGVNHLVKN